MPAAACTHACPKSVIPRRVLWSYLEVLVLEGGPLLARLLQRVVGDVEHAQLALRRRLVELVLPDRDDAARVFVVEGARLGDGLDRGLALAQRRELGHQAVARRLHRGGGAPRAVPRRAGVRERAALPPQRGAAARRGGAALRAVPLRDAAQRGGCSSATARPLRASDGCQLPPGWHGATGCARASRWRAAASLQRWQEDH